MPMRKNMQKYTRFKDSSNQNKVSGWKNPDVTSSCYSWWDEEVQGQEAHHGAHSLQAEVMETRTVFRKIKWLITADKTPWHDFDTSIGKIVNISAKGISEKPTIDDVQNYH